MSINQVPATSLLPRGQATLGSPEPAFPSHTPKRDNRGPSPHQMLSAPFVGPQGPNTGPFVEEEGSEWGPC